MGKPDYDTTLARMAGNIAGSLVVGTSDRWDTYTAKRAVTLARLIVAEIKQMALEDAKHLDPREVED